MRNRYEVEEERRADGSARITLTSPRDHELAVYRCGNPRGPGAEKARVDYGQAAQALNEAAQAAGRGGEGQWGRWASATRTEEEAVLRALRIHRMGERRTPRRGG